MPVLPEAGCTDGGLSVAFNPMYSAFDGTHTYAIPAVVYGSAGKVTWSADSTMVGMQADPERPNEVLIQTLKVGDVIINVQSDDGKCGSAPLFISQAAVSDWEIGNARYNDGQSPPPRGGGVAREQEPTRARWGQRSSLHELPRRDRDERPVHGRVAHARADRRVQ